jgi:hypothetical protein
MIADLRALRSRDIWYMSKHDRHVPGKLTQLSEGGSAQVCLEAGDWGVNWLMDNVPYGTGQLHHWYFHEPSEEARIVMANLGVEMTDEEMIPQWQTVKVAPLKKRVQIEAMPYAPPSSSNPNITLEVVKTAVETALEKHDKKNNDADSPSAKRVGVPGRAKTAAAN